MSNLTQSFHGAASFTSGKRLNIFVQKQYSPSPNQYMLKSTLSNSATKFGKSQRTDPKCQTPSVGKYDLDYENKRKLKITIKGKRKQERESSIVGPGSYTIELPKAAQKFGFGDRFMQTYETETPAPNQYNLNGFLKKSVNKKDGFMLSTSKQDSIYTRSKTPAPGQYETNLTSTTNQTFSRAPRDVYQINTPGPGSYHYETRDSKGFSFLSKYKQHEPPNFPGPGTYDVENNLKSNGTIKFNSILRQTIFEKIKSESPGPGAYLTEYYTSKSKGTKFYTCPKIFDYSTKVPGPGAYEPQLSSLLKQGGVIGKLYQPKRISATPGPGQYDEYQVKLLKSSTWSKTKRFREDRADSVGPGKYQAESSFSKTGVSFAKTKTNRDPVVKQLFDPPGPGHYDLDGEVGYIPNYLLKQQK